MTTMEESLGVLKRAGFAKSAALEIQMNALAMAIGWATLGSDGDAGAPRSRVSGGSARIFEQGLEQYLSSLSPR